MAKPKRSKREHNLEFVVDGDYVTMTYSEWQKATRKWHEEQYMFHVDYLEEFKDLKQPRSLSKCGSSGYLTCANMIEFSYDYYYKSVSGIECHCIKNKNLNEVCSYIAITENGFIVVPKGDYSSYAIDKHSTTFDNLDDALKMLESLN